VTRSWKEWLGLAAPAVVLVAGGAYLYAVPPEKGSIYPPCLFHALTGWHCPGCGTTRCLHALLHGDLRQAAAYNVVALVLLPLIAFWGLRAWFAALTGRTWQGPRLPPWSVYLFLGFCLAFWVLRNLPFSPFDALAPHRL